MKRKRTAPTQDEPWNDNTPEAKLCRAADKAGISIDGYAARFTGKKAFPPAIIAKAKAIERSWDVSAKNRVLEMGGSWNGERKQVQSRPEDETVLAWLRKNWIAAGPTKTALCLDLKVSEAATILNRLHNRGVVGRNPEGLFVAGSRR